MNYNTAIKSQIDEIIYNNRNLNNSNSENINVKNYEARGKLISDLSELVNDFPVYIKKISDFLQEAIHVQNQDYMAMNSLLKIQKENKNNNWLVVAKKRKSDPNMAKYKIEIDKQKEKIKVTESTFLDAFVVNSFKEVTRPGELYYVTTADHFAIIINSKLLHGNIGNIYTEEKNPEKIKECKFAKSCIKQASCDYYHDPMKFAGSKDNRNFIASSWLYTPPNSNYTNRIRSRRFGSKNNIDVDISFLQPEEVTRFHDQVFHDLLCLLILKNKNQS